MINKKEITKIINWIKVKKDAKERYIQFIKTLYFGSDKTKKQLYNKYRTRQRIDELKKTILLKIEKYIKNFYPEIYKALYDKVSEEKIVSKTELREYLIEGKLVDEYSIDLLADAFIRGYKLKLDSIKTTVPRDTILFSEPVYLKVFRIVYKTLEKKYKEIKKNIFNLIKLKVQIQKKFKLSKDEVDVIFDKYCKYIRHYCEEDKIYLKQEYKFLKNVIKRFLVDKVKEGKERFLIKEIKDYLNKVGKEYSNWNLSKVMNNLIKEKYIKRIHRGFYTIR